MLVNENPIDREVPAAAHEQNRIVLELLTMWRNGMMQSQQLDAKCHG